MSASRFAARLFEPGRVSFASLFAIESVGRAALTVVLPVEALRIVGDARDVSLIFAAMVCLVLLASQGVPLLVRGLGPRRVYAIAGLLMIAVPLSLAASSLTGVAMAILLRGLAMCAAMNALQLLIMAHIERRELSRMEPLRVFAAAGVWVLAPVAGIKLFEQVAPWAAYGLAIAAALLFLAYLAALRPSPAPRPGIPAPAAPRFAPLRNLRRYFAQPRLRLAYVLNVARESWWAMFFVYVPIYMVTAGQGAEAGGYLVSAGTALLFLTPLFGRLARRVGMRKVLMLGFIATGATMILAAAFTPWPWAFATCALLSALGAVALDSVSLVTFQRAVRARERPEMMTVFATYRDMAALASTGFFSLLLSFFGLWSVFAATGIWLVFCAWFARWIPRGM